MSDTPRTDAAWYASESGAGCEPLLKCSLQLERELRESEASVAVMREVLGYFEDCSDHGLARDVEHALATNSGRKLLAEVERYHAELASLRHKVVAAEGMAIVIESELELLEDIYMRAALTAWQEANK